MKIAEQTNDRLIVESNDHAFGRLLLFLSVVSIGVALVMLFAITRAWRTESFQGVGFAAVIFFSGFLLVFERARFIFDRAGHLLTWHRRRAFSSASGVVQFQHIRDVVLQTSMGNAVNPKRRIALLLADGELPLSLAYAPDVNGSARDLAETIRKTIGLP